MENIDAQSLELLHFGCLACLLWQEDRAENKIRCGFGFIMSSHPIQRFHQNLVRVLIIDRALFRAEREYP